MTIASNPAQSLSSTALADRLVGPEWLEAHLRDPNVRVVEVDVSPTGYDQGHIDGAVLWNIYRDLKDPDYRPVPPAAFEDLLGRSGIRADMTVVFYGYAPSIGLWLLELYGHADARILNCSRDTWQAEGRPWGVETPEPSVGEYDLGNGEVALRADASAVRDAVDSADTTLIDVRTTAEYDGECFWPSGTMEPDGRAGHIPSALHQPIDGLYDERGAFRSPEELRGIFSEVDLGGEHLVITYCTIGGRAATAWFVLTYLLGRRGVRVYDGSWAEWGRRPGAPIESL